RRDRRDGPPALPRDPDAISRSGEGLLHRLDTALRKAGAVPRGYGRKRPLAVPQHSCSLAVVGVAVHPARACFRKNIRQWRGSCTEERTIGMMNAGKIRTGAVVTLADALAGCQGMSRRSARGAMMTGPAPTSGFEFDWLSADG